MEILKLSFILLLIFMNGFFVATEFAIVKVRSTRIRILAAEGSWRARLAEKVTHNLDGMLSATQLGITLVTIALGWAGERWIAEIIFEPLFRFFGAENASGTLVHSLAFVSSYVAISAAHIVVGELAPKSLAIQRAEGTTLWVAVPITVFYFLFFPAIWILNGAANLMLRLIGVKPASEHETALGDEELRLILARSQRSGHLTMDEQRLMENVLNMTEKTARQVMDPRTEIVYLSTEKSLEENLRIARDSGHTRFPVCDGNLDKILGMVHVKDLAWAFESKSLSPDFREIRREMHFLPDTVTLDRALRAFQQGHTHMAILVDEYGATVGMITLDSVLEEVVGEIQDEFDRKTPLIQQVRRGEYRVDATCPLDLFRQVFGMEPVKTESATVGGLVFDLHGRLPKRGHSVPFGDDRFIVESVAGQRIESLRFSTQRAAKFSPSTATGEGKREPVVES